VKEREGGRERERERRGGGVEEEEVLEEVEEKRACRDARSPSSHRRGALRWTDDYGAWRLAFELLHLAPCPVRARLVT